MPVQKTTTRKPKPKPVRGRPRIPRKDKRLTFSAAIRPDAIDAIDRAAIANGLSRSRLIELAAQLIGKAAPRLAKIEARRIAQEVGE